MPNRRNKAVSNPQLVILGNPLGADVAEAYERLHWTEPESVIEVEAPDGISAPALILIGKVHEIKYSTGADSERTKISDLWSHEFDEPALLCTTPDGDVLIVLGGKLQVTPRGIEG